ncbi:hypothetical protein PCNPT3_04660 [Psychromonas sp. CNPT3]|uniref:DUF3781 domain-containing protein n=1 Tax=Psychromonas sp. CNPT3 TaxID=314282 RepID=UPI0002C04C31|nr:DUF3781 domain-containing protein [Psychromonas sp. CNPT3]AGH80874.1 hypothetical protein PCNPT3_04660 [Psychromonas sp. CNPT3]
MNEALKVSITKGFKNTLLGFVRIRKNLDVTHFSDIETEAFIEEILLSTPLEDIETKGKNHYFRCVEKNAILTVNAHRLTIITAKTINNSLRTKKVT